MRPREDQGTRTGLQAPGRCQKRLTGLRMRPRAWFGTGRPSTETLRQAVWVGLIPIYSANSRTLEAIKWTQIVIAFTLARPQNMGAALKQRPGDRIIKTLEGLR